MNKDTLAVSFRHELELISGASVEDVYAPAAENQEKLQFKLSKPTKMNVHECSMQDNCIDYYLAFSEEGIYASAYIWRINKLPCKYGGW